MVSSHVNFSEQIDLWPPLAGELLNTLTAPLGQSGVEPRPACAGVAERQMVGQEGGSANPAANNKTSNAQAKQSEHFWEASTPNIVCETWYSFFHTNNRLHAVVIISQNRFASVGSQKSEPAAMCRMSTSAHREKNWTD